MIPFLESVAKAYSLDPEARQLLPETWFVFPNKRAGTFFLKYLRKYSGDLSFAPTVTTITDFVADLSGRTVNTRLDSIFLLHKCYTETISPHLLPEARKSLTSFDSFRRWGETILRDFNEVDMHMADADALFKNLYDFRSIATPFLTDEQKNVMEEYFGYRPVDYSQDRFWQKFGKRLIAPEEEAEGTSDDSPSEKFIHLWRLLSPLYHRYHEALSEKGLTTSGGVYRLAVENLREAIDTGIEKVATLLPCRKIVMIGFNALSMAERNLFFALKSLEIPGTDHLPMADFIWDATGPIISDHKNSAGRFIAINRRDFPAPKWVLPYLRESHTDSLPPRIEAIACPSNVMQVKIASKLIADLKNDPSTDPELFNEARVAMVLPNENLLLPLLYSIPEEIEDANLTMGYPLKLTSVTSFLALIRRMQLIRRDSSSYDGYSFEEVRNLLGHPYSHAIFGTSKIRNFINYFQHHHISVVKDSDLERLGRAAVEILSPLPHDATPETVIAYLEKVLASVENAILQANSGKGNKTNSSLELVHLGAWRDALMRLDDTIDEYGVSLSVAGTLAEAYRLLQGETIAFAGEPLKGLQIMGMLETRAIDFEHLIVISVNDHILPRRSRQRSFLPNILRRAYGLPPINYAESLFSYYFYRMMSRAKSVTLLYDGRDSSRAGGPSRYLMQLDHIYARGKVKHVEYRFDLQAQEARKHTIVKTPEIMETLALFRSEGNEKESKKYLSATAIKKYFGCQVKFYLNTVCGFRDDPEPMETVNPITYGNIVHTVMENILIPDENMRGKWLDPPITLTSEKLDAILADEESLIKKIKREINLQHHHVDPGNPDEDRPLPHDSEVIARAIFTHVTNTLRYDRDLTPFNLYGCEISGELKYPVSDGGYVNMRYAIDRVDDAGCENPGEVRVIDYKTGSVHIEAPSLEAIFKGDYRGDHLFQLLLYADMLNLKREEEGKSKLTVKPVIYDIPRIHLPKKRKSIPKIGDTEIEYCEAEGINEEFLGKTDEVIREIFNPDTPFTSETDENKCQLCLFKSICY